MMTADLARQFGTVTLADLRAQLDRLAAAGVPDDSPVCVTVHDGDDFEESIGSVYPAVFSAASEDPDEDYPALSLDVFPQARPYGEWGIPRNLPFEEETA